MKRTDVKKYVRGALAMVESTLTLLQQKNLNIYLARDAVWSDIHLSKKREASRLNSGSCAVDLLR